jgi:hypothetical protein
MHGIHLACDIHSQTQKMLVSTKPDHSIRDESSENSVK